MRERRVDRNSRWTSGQESAAVGWDRGRSNRIDKALLIGLCMVTCALLAAASWAIQGNGAMQIVIPDPGWKSATSNLGKAPAKTCSVAGGIPAVVFTSYLDYSSSEVKDECDDTSSLLTANGVLCRDYDGGFDHVVASVGLRNTECGSIELAGAPPTATLAGAWLYVGLLESKNTPPAPVIELQFNGEPVVAWLVGERVEQPCWNDLDSDLDLDFLAYRAIVTEAMLPAVNGKYEVDLAAVLSGATNDGSDPWQNPLGSPSILEGASLVALYADRSIAKTSRVTINEGPAYLWPALIVKNPLSSISSKRRKVRLSRIGSDGQERIAGVSGVPVLPFATRFGIGGGWDYIAGPNSAINPNGDFEGEDGGPMRQLQDGEMTEWKLGMEFASATGYWVSYEPVHIDPADADHCVWVDCVNVIAHILTSK